MSALIPIFDSANLTCPSTILEGFDVAGWRSIVWAISGAGTLPAAYLWVSERWSFPDDTDSGWPADLAQPSAIHVIPGIGNPLFIDYQLRCVTPQAPLLTLEVTQHPGAGQRCHARVWASHHELTTAELWPGPFVLAEALSVDGATTVSLPVPAYVGPAIAHAWSNATDAISRIDLRNGTSNPGNRLDILWKPGATVFSRPVMLPPGPATIDLVNNDVAPKSFDVALTPYGRG